MDMLPGDGTTSDPVTWGYWASMLIIRSYLILKPYYYDTCIPANVEFSFIKNHG